MKIKCAIISCGHKTFSNTFKVKGSGFYYFPNYKNNKNLREKWITTIGGLKYLNTTNYDAKHLFICNKHFKTTDFVLEDRLKNVPVEKQRLQPNAIPSINLPKTNEQSSCRERRNCMRQNRKVLIDTLNTADTLSEAEIPSIEKELVPLNLCKSTQTIGAATNNENLLIYELNNKIKSLEKENKTLKIIISKNNEENKSIKTLFSTTQLKRLQNIKMKTKWTLDDISKAMSLYFHSLNKTKPK